MGEPRGLRECCESVRFSLDQPHHRAPQGRTAIAGMVAQFRAQGLRVTRTITPQLHRCVERVAGHLCMAELPEVYVINDRQANAFAPAYGISDRPVLVLHSGLVELLAPNELDFAIGHELGHLGLEHAADPVAPGASAFEAFQARSRQRYAEISADRVGMVASRSVFTAARVMVKLASGLGEGVNVDIDAFLRQLTTRPDELDREWELHQSHPGLPLRLWALLRFSETADYLALSGTPGAGHSLKEVDDAVAERLGSLGKGRLDELEQDACRLALVWLGAYLVLDDDQVDERERAALTELVGEELAQKVLRFAEDQGAKAVEAKLRDALARAKAGSQAMREQFLAAFVDFAAVLGVAPRRCRAWQVVEQSLPGDAARISLAPRD